MDPIFPPVDNDVPLPKNATEAMPSLTPMEELEMRARTITLLSELMGRPLEPTPEQQVQAAELAEKMVMNPEMRPAFNTYPNETMAYLAGLVAQSNAALVEELSELKHYVINKLIYEVEHASDSRARIAALSKLGEVDGVDAFKKRSEVTMKVKPIEEVERELKDILDNIEYKVIGGVSLPRPEATQQNGPEQAFSDAIFDEAAE
jgi:hypothetical protein